MRDDRPGTAGRPRLPVPKRTNSVFVWLIYLILVALDAGRRDACSPSAIVSDCFHNLCRAGIPQR